MLDVVSFNVTFLRLTSSLIPGNHQCHWVAGTDAMLVEAPFTYNIHVGETVLIG